MKRKLIGCMLALGMVMIAGCGQQQSKNMEYIGAEQAKDYALREAGMTADSATFSVVEMDERAGLQYYNVDFAAQGQEYEYDVDALTGVVIEGKVSASKDAAAPVDATSTATPQASAATPSADMITAEQAKSAALKHAGLTADAVNFVQARLDNDDRRQTYDVEFYGQDGKEYDYEIDAQTGEVVSYDYDADAYTPPASTDKSISADKAKQIALEQVPGATTSNIREFETDYDDGRLEYEGKIIFDGREYEFEIDGYSGAIRSWDSEPIEY